MTTEAPTDTGYRDLLTDRLFRQRTILLTGEVNDAMAERVCSELVLLATTDPQARHRALHQFTWRIGVCRSGHLRHYEAHPQRRRDGRDGLRRQHGPGCFSAPAPTASESAWRTAAS